MSSASIVTARHWGANVEWLAHQPLAVKAGLDPATLAGALAGGAAKSWVLENRWQRMAEDRYPLGFRVALHRKDLGIAIELAEELGIPVPAARLVAQLEDALIADGKGGDDLSALAHQLRRLAASIDG